MCRLLLGSVSIIAVPSNRRSSVRSMLAGDKPLTLPARTVGPHLHLDNRGLVVFDGSRGAILPENMLGWVRETIGLLLDEKRATRHRGDHYFGGMVADDGSTVTLYAGPADALVAVEVPVDALREVLERLGAR